MKPYAEVIGDPIAHSKSPLIHTFWLDKLGLAERFAYRKTHVRPGELADFLAGRRADPLWRGCNVTIPHKEPVAQLVDELDAAKVKAIGAVNTVVPLGVGRLLGTNTDVDGVGEAVAAARLDGRAAVVLGAGGAGRAAFAWLKQAGCADVRVMARNAGKAQAAIAPSGLHAGLFPFAPDSGAFAGAALVINSTQLGMNGQEPMPAFVLDELAALAPDALVFDMVYAPLETALLKAARARGLATADGLEMLVGQAATAFEKFFGVAAPRQHDAELRGILTS